MNAEMQEQAVEAFVELREAFGVEITIAGQDGVSALVSESAVSRELTAGGFQAGGEFTARVLLAELNAAPVIGAAVTCRGIAYKIGEIKSPDDYPIAELTLRPAKR